jgi:type II secretory ATPase GspE/PulE/Tfp pilus assembly ATPase PilB-like protein
MPLEEFRNPGDHPATHLIGTGPHMFDYVNVIFWVIALASLIAWAKFSTFVADDVTNNLVQQPEVPWKLGVAGVGLLMLVVWIAMPSFWVALIVNAVVAGSFIGAFWYVRVQALGPAGHLFRGAISAAGNLAEGHRQKKNAGQVQLTYLRHDGSSMPLPPPGDPLSAGLGTADQIVIQALMRRAEMIDLAPGPNGYGLSLVTDGMPAVQPAVDRTSAEAAIQAFKVLAGLSAEERRRPQAGTFRSRDPEGSTTVWSVKTSGSTAGERAVLLANEKGQWDIPVDALGFSTDQLATVKKLTSSTEGLVIVTGPHGSGRTTTLYSLLRSHDAFTNSVQTLEVNPQTDIEGATINKFENRPDSSFSKQLQSIFLKDPNVVLVSQLPDKETADLIARYVNGNDGNHERRRVYTSLPALDTFAALDTWMALSSSKSEAANALSAIIAERLVRILCPTCKIPYQPDEATLKKLNLPAGRNLQSHKANTEPIIDKRGNKIICPDCNGIGFRGRTGIFEVLLITDDIRKALTKGATGAQVKTLARKNNLILLIEHGIRKFATGVTAINEVTRVMNEKPPPPAAGRTGIMPPQK